MSQNPLVEQAKQGNVNAIASLMNRLLKSQGMLANVEREGDRLEILIESDLRSLDDEVRIPKRQVLVGMIKKWFITLEVQTISSLRISWQQTGFVEPAWTDEVYLVDQAAQNVQTNDEVSQNGGITEPLQRPKIPPLPVFPPPPMRDQERNPRDRFPSDQPAAESPDLDEMFGEANTPKPLELPNPNLTNTWETDNSSQDSGFLLLSDIPPTANEELNNFQSDNKLGGNFSWKMISQTPSFAIQFVQYLVICGVIILSLRSIHAIFGSHSSKATSIAPQTVVKT
ncbi:hypothetical protein H6F42_09770 [Pseudanabaena sp. FACHB-1998]|uniref:hypothetical protein n=1 Tax=Pseudanabaena sp. FACHB-1998 TaxID=2692858 RepID=UPI001680D96F|nr:hypothetical protein [Pseudanabaena sp. FACHB-1998]MBD2177197.1 hypothetical protein [Pseudanabaena sp. FACHB-1998]